MKVACAPQASFNDHAVVFRWPLSCLQLVDATMDETGRLYEANVFSWDAHRAHRGVRNGEERQWCSEPTKLDRFWLEFSAPIPRLGERRAMKASRFSDAQKAFILKQGADGMPVADICRKAGISQATYFNWKKKYAGLLPTEMRRLKQLEDENNKLRKVVADLSLDKEMLQDALRRKL
jgi:hypothetical protein